MNNNNTPALIRTLIIYGLCIPLAIWLGFMLADPFDRATFSYFGIMALLLVAPILLRWHHFLLVAFWNLNVTFFFLPGNPPLWLLMVALSLGISILQRTVTNKAQFISAPLIQWPLYFLLAVAFVTAELTGGFGMKSLGSESVGGHRYIYLFLAILGYFALTANRIPPKNAGWYVGLFFCTTCAGIVGDLYGKLPSALNYVFLMFPASTYTDTGDVDAHIQVVRLAGLGVASLNICLFMLARYGIRGIFMTGRPGLFFLYALFSGLILLGGFRTWIVIYLMVFTFLFFMERLHQTRFLMVAIFFGLITAALIVPFSNKLPFTAQRALTIVPYLNIDPVVRLDAQASSDWRVQMWQAVLPQLPDHLLLGKGYYVSATDFQNQTTKFGIQADAANWGSAIAGDYHNGPLSVVMFFGIWGVIAVLWFWSACLRALYLNYRHGDPALHTYNTFFFVYFLTKILMFLFIFGNLYSDMFIFTGIIGMSISLNGGIRRPAPAPVRVVDKNSTAPMSRPHFQPFYQG